MEQSGPLSTALCNQATPLQGFIQKFWLGGGGGGGGGGGRLGGREAGGGGGFSVIFPLKKKGWRLLHFTSMSFFILGILGVGDLTFGGGGGGGGDIPFCMKHCL